MTTVTFFSAATPSPCRAHAPDPGPEHHHSPPTDNRLRNLPTAPRNSLCGRLCPGLFTSSTAAVSISTPWCPSPDPPDLTSPPPPPSHSYMLPLLCVSPPACSPMWPPWHPGIFFILQGGGVKQTCPPPNGSCPPPRFLLWGRYRWVCHVMESPQ